MQETKSLTMPVSKAVVVVKGYMTGLVDQEIEKIKLGANKSRVEKEIDPAAGDFESAGPMKMVMETDPTVEIEADNKMIELMVISIDGELTDVLNKVLELPKADVDYIKNELKEVEDTSKVQVDGDPKAPEPSN